MSSLALLTPLLAFSYLYSHFKRIKKNTSLSYAVLGLIPFFLLALWLVFAPRGHPNRLDYNPYELLGVSENATTIQIKRKYRRLSLELHPDRVAKDKSPEEREIATQYFQKIIYAQEILTNEEKRKNYDETGHPEGRAWWDDEYPDWIVRPNATALFITYGTIGAALILIPLAMLVLIPALKEPPLFVRNYFFDEIERIDTTQFEEEKYQEALEAFRALNDKWETTEKKFPRWNKSDWYPVMDFNFKARIAFCEMILGNLEEANNSLNEFKKNHRETYKKKSVNEHLKALCDQLKDEAKQMSATVKGADAKKLKTLAKTISSIA